MGPGKNSKLRFSSYSHIRMIRLGYLRVYDCPAELEPPAGARNRRKATVNIRINPQFRILPLIQINFLIGNKKNLRNFVLK